MNNSIGLPFSVFLSLFYLLGLILISQRALISLLTVLKLEQKLIKIFLIVYWSDVPFFFDYKAAKTQKLNHHSNCSYKAFRRAFDYYLTLSLLACFT